MRPGALIPALAFGAALLAPPIAEADHHRSPERGRRSGYERSNRGHGRYDRGRSGRSYRRGHSRRSYKRGHYRPSRRHRPSYRPRRPGYYRPWSRPYYSHRPYPHRYYAPYPAPYGYPGPGYGPYPPYRGGVHGSVSIGLPFIGFSLHF
jgi:hypothetical protein